VRTPQLLNANGGGGQSWCLFALGLVFVGSVHLVTVECHAAKHGRDPTILVTYDDSIAAVMESLNKPAGDSPQGERPETLTATFSARDFTLEEFQRLDSLITIGQHLMFPGGFPSCFPRANPRFSAFSLPDNLRLGLGVDRRRAIALHRKHSSGELSLRLVFTLVKAIAYNSTPYDWNDCATTKVRRYRKEDVSPNATIMITSASLVNQSSGQIYSVFLCDIEDSCDLDSRFELPHVSMRK